MTLTRLDLVKKLAFADDRLEAEWLGDLMGRATVGIGKADDPRLPGNDDDEDVDEDMFM
jgi:hypothetical protein